MSKISLGTMISYLSRSISSINQNKLHGTLAEIDLRNTLTDLGFGERISQGGWIVRNVGSGNFAHHTNVFFPETILADTDYRSDRDLPEPPRRLHTICSTMHQIGIHSYYCIPKIINENDCESINWYSTQLGIPARDEYHLFPDFVNNFPIRERRYNFLRYHSDASLIPEESIPEEFTKEHLRIKFQDHFMAEISDIDGVLWGQEKTYPIEIKEKTPGTDKKVGEFFGIDVGPFVKLAFYASKRGNLHSLFIVREINNTDARELVNWWFITFDILAQYASWVPIGGGVNMQGGGSSTIKIPKSEFKVLNEENLSLL